jgi:hypothetical protein
VELSSRGYANDLPQNVSRDEQQSRGHSLSLWRSPPWLGIVWAVIGSGWFPEDPPLSASILRWGFVPGGLGLLASDFPSGENSLVIAILKQQRPDDEQDFFRDDAGYPLRGKVP